MGLKLWRGILKLMNEKSRDTNVSVIQVYNDAVQVSKRLYYLNNGHKYDDIASNV